MSNSRPSPRANEFIPLSSSVERKIHLFAMDLPHSDAGFVQAYPAETTEAFCARHVAAFGFDAAGGRSAPGLAGGVASCVRCASAMEPRGVNLGDQMRHFGIDVRIDRTMQHIVRRPHAADALEAAGNAAALDHALRRSWRDAFARGVAGPCDRQPDPLYRPPPPARAVTAPAGAGEQG